MPLSLPYISTSRAEVQTRIARRILAAITATLAVALAAHISFPLPFTPVPFTLQPLAVLLVGLLLGPVDGTLAMVAYLLEGAAGLPVFSPTGPGGLLQLLGPTGGFLLVYPAVAFTVGFVARKAAPSMGFFAAAALGGLAATVLLFTSGAGWLASVTSLHGHALWLAAVGPFLPGEAIKVLVAAGVYRAISASPGR